MSLVGLTERQSDLLRFLRSYHAKHGYAPSLMEQAKHLGATSKTTAFHLLKKIEERGHIRRLPGQRGAIEFIDGPWEIPSIVRNEFDAYCKRTDQPPGQVIGHALLIYLRHPSRRLEETANDEAREGRRLG